MSECKKSKKDYPPCELAPIRVAENFTFDFYFNRFEYFDLRIREIEFGTEYQSIHFSSNKNNQAEVISFKNLTKHTGTATSKQLNDFFKAVGI